MRFVLNLVWLVFGGLCLTVGYAVAGLVLLVTVIGIPFGIAACRIAVFTLWPFGRRVVDDRESGAGSAIGNVLWFVLAGWWLALGHIVCGAVLCVTIIGIPLGVGHFKLVPVSLLPLGRTIVDSAAPYTFR